MERKGKKEIKVIKDALDIEGIKEKQDPEERKEIRDALDTEDQ